MNYFLEELQRLNEIDEIFDVVFYNKDRKYVWGTMVQQNAAKFYNGHRDEFDYFVIQFVHYDNKFVCFNNIQELSEYNYKREHKIL